MISPINAEMAWSFGLSALVGASVLLFLLYRQSIAVRVSAALAGAGAAAFLVFG